MKKTVSLLLLFCFLVSLTAVGAVADGPYTDGVYTGTAQGFGGEVSVTLTVEDGEIKEAAVVGDGETQGVGSRAIEMMPERIVAAQSAEIDGVSGCTFSSTAVKAAAQAAIDQALGTTAAEAAEIKMEPGTYTGHGTGYGIIGQLAMDVTVDEAEIVSIDVNDSNRETATIFGAAVEKLVPRILENQSLEVDAITGATSSSNGIKAAVADALSQAIAAAGTDASAIQNFYRPVEKKTDEQVIDVDVVVVGMGSAGCSAAMAAAEAQAAKGQEVSVLAVEQAGLYGGTSHLTGSPMGVNPQKYSEEYNNGEEYVNADEFKADWYAYADGDAKQEMIDLFIDESGETIDWLTYDHGFWFCQPRKEKETEFKVCMDFVFDGKKEADYEYPRTFGNRVEAVGSYFDQLIADYTALGGQYLLETKATGYLYDETEKRVTGITAVGDDGTQYTINAKAVIIGTGGFAGNTEMMEKYVTQPTGKASAWPIFGYTINDGVMIQSAIDDLGAATYNIDMVPVSHYNSIAAIMKDYPVEVVEGKMDSRWNYPAVRSINDVPMTFAINPLGLWITTEGERVVNESAFHVAWRLGAHYWSLWGQDEINDIRENGFPYVESTRAFGQGGFDANMPLPELDEILDKCVDMGVLYRASSIEELAKMINVDAATLSGVIADYNSACEAGEDAVMGKGAENLRPVTGDTYYAFKCINYTYGTDGGLDVDEQLNVLREDGSVIDGLYATGYDCSGVLYNSNKAYVDYGGAALGWGFTSGRLAGQNAVEAING